MLSRTCFTQSVNVPLSHWVYRFLDRLETRGIFNDISTKSYPLSRTDVAEILADINKHKTELSKTESAIFEQLKGEFY